MNLFIVASLAIGICFVRILYLVFRAARSPLRSIPGPFIARFTDIWYLLRVSKGRFEYDNIELHRKHGEIVHYGPNRYSISSVAAQKIIYGHGSKFPKSSWYDTWGNPDKNQWTLFTDQNMKRHRENRRQYQNAYSMSSMVSYESYVDECAVLFSQRLSEIASLGRSTNMGHWFQCYAFDVIGLITYSKRLGFLDAGVDVGNVIAALENHLQYATLLGIYSWLHPYILPLRNKLSGGVGTGRAYIMNFTKERIAAHQVDQAKALHIDQADNSQETIDFLTNFFIRKASEPEKFTMFHVVSGCMQNMVAGSDTTGITLSAILYYLLKNPATFNQLRDEVDTLDRARGRTSFVTFEESQGMPYLQAVMKEALRMHPAAGLPLERVVPEGGATICDRFFPEGTIVGINAWVSHRDTSIFGSDADAFKPSRWLIDDKEKLSVMERGWMPFGLGSRTCIGRHISFLEMSKLIPVLVRDFDFELDEAIQVNDWSTTNHWFVNPTNFRLKVTMRKRTVKSG